jgi:methylenetetrahydrofolate dehydrogenase (NADP+)/methenyltetrahydrofolate cyclohydrolase
VLFSDLLITERLPINGVELAAGREAALTARVQQLKTQGKFPTIAAILFTEDAGSVLYTRLKQEAAERMGIVYQLHRFSLQTPLVDVLTQIQMLNQDPSITGIIIQKPYRTTQAKADYQAWWQALIMAIDPKKDVDGLTPNTLAAVRNNTWRAAHAVLPATCRAVLVLLSYYTRLFEVAPELRSGLKVAVIGRSELLGLPLAAELTNQKFSVTLLGKAETAALVEQQKFLHDYDLVITAAGQPGFLKGAWLKPQSMVVDVGEPRGDVEFVSAVQVAAVVTPVPGGVGPLTVSCLMENSLDLLEIQ